MSGLRTAVLEFTTLRASFEDDLDAYRAAGAEAIGICEPKLVEGREGEQLEAFRASGLAAASCVPAVPSILPLPALPGPERVEERVEALAAGLRRLAPFEPSAVVCLTGPAGQLGEPEVRAAVVEGLRAAAAEAARLGLRLGLEPMQRLYRDGWTLPTSLDEAAGLLDEAGLPGVGLVFDTWHLWNAPGLAAEIERHAQRIVAVHVSDWREPTRGWCDRALPGAGSIDLGSALGALEDAGWRGFHELEVFSDDGTFGDAYEDSLWRLPAEQIARRGLEGLLAAGAVA